VALSDAIERDATVLFRPTALATNASQSMKAK